jgi:hypothetical protein
MLHLFLFHPLHLDLQVHLIPISLNDLMSVNAFWFMSGVQTFHCAPRNAHPTMEWVWDYICVFWRYRQYLLYEGGMCDWTRPRFPFLLASRRFRESTP